MAGVGKLRVRWSRIAPETYPALYRVMSLDGPGCMTVNVHPPNYLDGLETDIFTELTLQNSEA